MRLPTSLFSKNLKNVGREDAIVGLNDGRGDLRRGVDREAPEVTVDELLKDPAVKINLNQPMKKVRAELSKYPIKTRLLLSGTIIVARDIAHAKINERLERGEGLPDYSPHEKNRTFVGKTKNAETKNCGTNFFFRVPFF